MKTHLIQVKCDNCGQPTTNSHELQFTLGRKGWVSDLCTKCEPKVLDYMTKLGMGGQQARKVSDLLPAKKDSTIKKNGLAVQPNAKSAEAQAKGQSYDGLKCRGCNEKYTSVRARRMHNTRSGCA